MIDVKPGWMKVKYTGTLTLLKWVLNISIQQTFTVTVFTTFCETNAYIELCICMFLSPSLFVLTCSTLRLLDEQHITNTCIISILIIISPITTVFFFLVLKQFYFHFYFTNVHK